ncbi:Bug family tripartite tricarboxylate transporter substrate binding protein [Roseomonas marmotae]|uniref:Tripartite tricarboxylate transporter substrate binding protein n=1 Tax=Roseomonas marmotae TaxID=2768161 RepID=A0ABS3K8Q7_9PROT|nr:tripartite tricarboxylate transporter substrate binding protein [Roseomonas marmotae]MBO1073852.1 tripartite tricarboxylate transporter substrate binding protein [Roseomonas marmotae]QTI78520.1 tripartite tricarboxylate transporter substrate binding protein [Roseomonas marmotae]
MRTTKNIEVQTMPLAFPLRRRALLAALPLLSAPAVLRAQPAWPSRTIRFINPGPAGGAGSVTARIVMERVSAILGQTIVIDDRPGAGTNIGMTAVAQSAPDGYTLGLSSIASNAVNKWIYKDMPFNPDRDFAAVSLMVLVPNIMVVPVSTPADTVAEFIAYGKKRGSIDFGSVGAGSSQHLAGAQFALATGIDMQHVPYTNSGQLNTDLMEGRTQVVFQSISAVAEMVKSGRMKALAVTGTQRLDAFPELPTLVEAGVDITSTGWFGVVTPAGVPDPILDKLHQAVVAAIADDQVRQKLSMLGSVPRSSPTRENFAAFMQAETMKYRDVIKASGASAN